MPNTNDYVSADQPHTLFPLTTTTVLLSNSFDRFLEHVYQRVLNPAEQENFLPQVHCYASKQGLHLRRTVKLDPIAEVFIYDVVYRNRQTFRPDFRNNRRSFGFRFRDGLPVLLTESYADFRQAVAEAKATYRYAARFDISNYFNSVYHHDLVMWFSDGGRSLSDAESLGKFLREANFGRSLDCLPQGLHPCKLLGAEYLEFVDNSAWVRSELQIRFMFMDDFYLFSDEEDTLFSDFITIQQMLGEKGLSINPEKTQISEINEIDVRREVDEIRAGLLRMRRHIIEVSALEVEPTELEIQLNEEQTVYLLNLLQDPNIDESDAELVLTLLGDHGTDVLQHMRTLLERFPSLSRKVFNYCRFLDDVVELARVLLEFLNTGRHITEDQLFWMTKIAEDFLGNTTQYPDIIWCLYNHPNSTEITLAKLLEIPIPEHRFGMPDLRQERLRTGRSDWGAWAAAIGCRNEQPIQRNHKLMYFANGSSMNMLVANCIHNI